MNNYFGVTIALVHVLLPFLILPLLANIQAINPEIETAARSLGASRWRAFWRVTLPLSMPGIQAGAVLVFVLSISAYVTPAMLGGGGGRTMSVLVVQYLVQNFRWPAGAALAIILAITAIVTVALFFALTHRVTTEVAMRRDPGQVPAERIRDRRLRLSDGANRADRHSVVEFGRVPALSD